MRRLAGLVVALVLVAGCATSSPEAVLQERANALVQAANAGDASATRTAAGLLLQEVNRQDAAADLAASKAQALVTLINRILANAGLLDETVPTPSPTFSEPPKPSPTPSPEAPSPTPSEESPSPEPSQVVPSIVVGDSGSPQPAPSQS
ncbi:MAG: hypothetical protein ABIO67_02455 [Mycobacteriales bacterium]